MPGVPSSVTVKEETSRHLTVSWKISKDSNAQITRYIVVYQPISNQMSTKGTLVYFDKYFSFIYLKANNKSWIEYNQNNIYDILIKRYWSTTI